MNRRNFLRLGLAAPAVILTPGLLMPVKSLWTPRDLTEESLIAVINEMNTFIYRWATPAAAISLQKAGWGIVNEPYYLGTRLFRMAKELE